MSFTQSVIDAIERLLNKYNANNYSGTENAGGFGNGGHVFNFHPALQDLANVASAVATEAQNAENAVSAASGYAEDAEGHATNAGLFAGAASDFADTAEEWAETAKDVPVSEGKYSAKHYALKAQESAESIDFADFSELPEELEPIDTVKFVGEDAEGNKIGVPFSAFGGGLPIGASFYWNGNTPPDKCLEENGATISKTTYPELFAVIGYNGGSGDNFILPDSRGEFIRGWDNSRGVDSGRTLLSTQSDQNKSHNHTGSIGNESAHTHPWAPLKGNSTQASDTNYPMSSPSSGSWGNYSVNTGAGTAHNHSVTINTDGGTEVRVRNIAKMVCIRAY
jgi:hypothetical protein